MTVISSTTRLRVHPSSILIHPFHIAMSSDVVGEWVITPLSGASLRHALADEVAAFASLLSQPPIDSIRTDYIVSLLEDRLSTHASNAAKRSRASTSASALSSALTPVERRLISELSEEVQPSLEEETESMSEEEATSAIKQFVRNCIQRSYGRTAQDGNNIEGNKHGDQDTAQTNNQVEVSIQSTGASASQQAASSAVVPPVSSSSSPSSSSPSSLSTLSSILTTLFPFIPLIHVESVLLACGKDLELSSDLLSHVSVDEIKWHDESENVESSHGCSLDPLTSILRHAKPDEATRYKRFLQIERRKAQDAVDRAKKGQPSTLNELQQQYLYLDDAPELKLKTQSSSFSSSSSSSVSVSEKENRSAERDPYYDSEEFLAIKKKVMEKYTYDQDQCTFHRPHLKLDAQPRKQTRYLSNQVVSTKGEKYTILADPKAEEREAQWRAKYGDRSSGKLHIIRTKKKGGVGHKFV